MIHSSALQHASCDRRSGIHAVIFDWGGVLMRTADHGFRLAWDARLGLEPGSMEQLVFGSAEWKQAQVGRLSEQAVWASLRARLNLSPEALAELRHDFWAGDQLDEELIALIRGLRPRFKTALLSNFPASLRALLTELGLTDTFDAIIISGEAGVVKPNAQIYHLAAERLGVPTGDCLFVDDFVENIVGARAAGMQALHFAPVETAMSELRRMTDNE